VEARPAITDAGVIVEPSLTSLTADGRMAIVIVAEDPGVDYAGLPEVVTRPDPLTAGSNGPARGDGSVPVTESPSSPAAFSDATGGGGLGPTPPRERTLGERMLSSPGVAPSGGRPAQGPRKVFVVLVPQTGGAAPQAVPAPASSTTAG
jgi:hypothetical protein